MPLALLIFLGLWTTSYAQHSEQPVKESATDLRSQFVLFSIEIPKDKKTFQLERTANQDYFIRQKIKKDETVQKIAGREAKQLEREFDSKFLKAQYELPTKEGSCDVVLHLNMKGEGQDICKKDDEKSQEFSPILENLSKRF